VFERFTERARQVVVLAQDEARALRHNYIGTEHLLLGLIREEEGIAAHVLKGLGVSLEEARAQVARIIGQGEELATGQIPFTPRAKRVLEHALREALSLGDGYIGTEHVLLGLVREHEGIAARILIDYGAPPDRVRDEVIRLLSGPGRLEEALRTAEPELPLTAPPVAQEVIDELARLREQKEQAIEAQEFDRAAKLRDRQRWLLTAARMLQHAWEERGEQPAYSRQPRSTEEGATAYAVARVRSGERRRLRMPDDPRPRTVFVGRLGLLVPFLLGALVLGVGLLLGWLIWG
jgi:Clp amino terminal domain, pathogenicity island component/UvrB/uvrC motif